MNVEWQPPKDVKRIIVCAANQVLVDGDLELVLGARHHDLRMNKTLLRLLKARYTSVKVLEQGFIDQFGQFYDRESALKIATAANQINVHRPKTQPENLLFSEDLY